LTYIVDTMDINISNKIESFLKRHPRNRLIILSKEKSEDLSFVDVGFELSKAIEKNLNQPKISMLTSDILEVMLQNNGNVHPIIGQYTAICNPGILLENALKIDFVGFLDAHSKNQTLILYWEGETEKNTLYFLSKTKGLQFDLTNISHIII